LNLQGFREFESHPHRQKTKDLDKIGRLFVIAAHHMRVGDQRHGCVSMP
jgi:hypothetical protein